MRAGIPIADLSAGLFCALGILLALIERETSNKGQHVETSLLHGSLSLQSGNTVEYAGKPTGFRPSPTYRLYAAGDGEWFFLACGNQSFWVKLCQALSSPQRVSMYFLPRNSLLHVGSSAPSAS